MTHFATVVQFFESVGDVVSIHKRIGAVDQQQINMIGRQQLQRFFRTGNNMRAVGNVMAQRIFRARRRRDPAFGHNLHFFTQMGSQFHSLTKRRFTLISTVDIGVIDGGHAQIQMLFNKAD